MLLPALEAAEGLHAASSLGRPATGALPAPCGTETGPTRARIVACSLPGARAGTAQHPPACSARSGGTDQGVSSAQGATVSPPQAGVSPPTHTPPSVLLGADHLCLLDGQPSRGFPPHRGEPRQRLRKPAEVTQLCACGCLLPAPLAAHPPYIPSSETRLRPFLPTSAPPIPQASPHKPGTAMLTAPRAMRAAQPNAAAGRGVTGGGLNVILQPSSMAEGRDRSWQEWSGQGSATSYFSPTRDPGLGKGGWAKGATRCVVSNLAPSITCTEEELGIHPLNVQGSAEER